MKNSWVDKIDCEHIALWLEIPVCTKIRLNVSKDYCDFCIKNGYNKRPLKFKEDDDA